MISVYRTATAQKEAEIHDLGTKPAVFQAERCNACGMQLDLPTVHFLCKHSFHQRCLDTTGIDNGHLHVPRDGQSAPNGVYTYGPSGTFPKNGWQSSNYWVDVVFKP